MPATTPLGTCTGPWTVHLCVTASCAGCGSVPVDEDTGLAPHFASRDQAVDELTQEWGWWFTAFPARLGVGEELLCPGCTTAAGYIVTPRPPALSAGPDGGQRSNRQEAGPAGA